MCGNKGPPAIRPTRLVYAVLSGELGCRLWGKAWADCAVTMDVHEVSEHWCSLKWGGVGQRLFYGERKGYRAKEERTKHVFK